MFLYCMDNSYFNGWGQDSSNSNMLAMEILYSCTKQSISVFVFVIMIDDACHHNKDWHIEAGTRWTPFRRRHFHVHFHQWKLLYFFKYVRKDPIDNNPALVQIMAWRRSGYKPLSEPMMVNLLTHISLNELMMHWDQGSFQCKGAILPTYRNSH